MQSRMLTTTTVRGAGRRLLERGHIVPFSYRGFWSSSSSSSGRQQYDESRTVLTGLSLGISAFALLGGLLRVDVDTQKEINKLENESMQQAVENEIRSAQQVEEIAESYRSQDEQAEKDRQMVAAEREKEEQAAEKNTKQQIPAPSNNIEGSEAEHSVNDPSTVASDDNIRWHMEKTLQNPSPQLEKSLREQYVKDIEPEAFDEAVRKHKGPVIVEVYQPGCPACRALLYRLRAVGLLTRQHMPEVKVVSIDGTKVGIPEEIDQNSFPRLHIFAPRDNEGKKHMEEVPLISNKLEEEEYHMGIPTVKTVLRQLESVTSSQEQFQQTPTIEEQGKQLELKCQDLAYLNRALDLFDAMELSIAMTIHQSKAPLNEGYTSALNDARNKLRFAQTILSEYNPDAPNELLVSIVKDLGDSIVGLAESYPPSAYDRVPRNFSTLNFMIGPMVEDLHDKSVGEVFNLRIAEAVAASLRHGEEYKSHQSKLNQKISPIVKEANMLMGE